VGTRGSVSRRAGDVVGSPLFLGSSDYSMLFMTSKRLLYTNRVKNVWSRAIHEQSVECVWHVDQFSSAGCKSIRITVTLEYE
jgi:hypothetical protein